MRIDPGTEQHLQDWWKLVYQIPDGPDHPLKVGGNTDNLQPYQPYYLFGVGLSGGTDQVRRAAVRTGRPIFVPIIVHVDSTGESPGKNAANLVHDVNAHDNQSTLVGLKLIIDGAVTNIGRQYLVPASNIFDLPYFNGNIAKVPARAYPAACAGYVAVLSTGSNDTGHTYKVEFGAHCNYTHCPVRDGYTTDVTYQLTIN